MEQKINTDKEEIKRQLQVVLQGIIRLQSEIDKMQEKHPERNIHE